MIIIIHFIFHKYPYSLTNQDVEMVLLNTDTSTCIYRIARVNQSKSFTSINKHTLKITHHKTWIHPISYKLMMMHNVQTHNICINVQSWQTFRSYLLGFSVKCLIGQLKYAIKQFLWSLFTEVLYFHWCVKVEVVCP
jgi:hypothetical protein